MRYRHSVDTEIKYAIGRVGVNEISQDVSLAICQQDELSQYMDRNLMSPQEIHKMETLKEDDNPVILKYYLK